MVDVISSKLLISFLESHDRLDTIGRIYGIESKKFSEAFEEHFNLHCELKELISLGLMEKEKRDCSGDVQKK